MGTTADKLNAILETKQAIRQAIITKGVEVGEDTKFSDYPSRIAAIQAGSGEGTGGASDAFYNLRTDNGTNFSNLFYCYGGSELDLSSLDTSQVGTMNNMFTYSYNLTSLNLSNWDTGNVYDMNSMFNNCSSLSSLDLSSFNTSSVGDMSYMFSYCTSLASLNLNNWDTRNVTNIDNMFNWCYGLEELDIRNFNVNNIEYITCMFEGCSMLHKLRLDNCDYDTINKIINSEGFPTGTVNGEKREIYCTENSSASIEQLPDGWKFVHVESSEGGEPGGGMPGIPGGGDEPEGPTITPEPEPGGGEVGPVIPPESEPSEPTETYAISFSTLGSKKLTVNNVDVTDQVVETGGYGDTISCKYETTDVIRQASFKDNTDLVRVFGLDTSMMFHTEEMFSGCTNLVAVLPMLESSMAYSTRAMFKNCTSLTSMDTIGGFSAASNKSEMFYNCTSLTGTVPSWDYWLNGAVTEYADCFYNCTALDNYSDIPASWGGPSDSE